MRVTHLIKAVGIAGAERHLLTLIPGLHARAVDTDLILLVEPERMLDEYVQLMETEGISVERRLIRRHFDPTLIPWLIVRLRQRKPDILHTHLIHADLYGTLAAQFAGVRVVTSRHNDDPFRAKSPYRQILQFLWHLTDAGIAISSAVARFSIETEGAPADKLNTIHYGIVHRQHEVDKKAARAELRQELQLPPDALVIGIISRLIAQKGIDDGLHAFKLVLDDFPDAHLVIAGDGALRQTLGMEAERLQLSSHVHFLGWRSNALHVMAALDVFLMPSLWEGFGLTLLEAMSVSVPIVATTVSAIPEIVAHQETGLLVPPHDVKSLADSLILLLGDSALRQHMGMLGEDRLETFFSADRMIDQILAVYQRVLG
ncbi:MAG: glycosyltransferase [Anaerolineae bacterium]|nr:glycosyltransferase [Anaerolineae bacterium]